MKLRLRKSVKSAMEFSVGNFDARMEPGQELEVKDEGFAAYLLGKHEVVKADSDEDADDVVEETLPEVESVPPTPSQEAEQDPPVDSKPATAKGSRKKGDK